MKENSTASSGIGFGSLLLLAFIVLKLTGFISWSWWWVLSPIWISLLIVLFVLLIVFLRLVFSEVRGKR